MSKGKNTPFDGREVYGRVEYTLADGEIVYEYQDTRKVKCSSMQVLGQSILRCVTV